MSRPDSHNPRQNEYFLPRDGIDKDVIRADIRRYLGPDALVRTGTYTNPATGQRSQGFFIKAYRNLTSAMIEDIKADSARWEQERQTQWSRHPTYPGAGAPGYSAGPGVAAQGHQHETRGPSNPSPQWYTGEDNGEHGQYGQTPLMGQGQPPSGYSQTSYTPNGQGYRDPVSQAQDQSNQWQRGGNYQSHEYSSAPRDGRGSVMGQAPPAASYDRTVPARQGFVGQPRGGHGFDIAAQATTTTGYEPYDTRAGSLRQDDLTYGSEYTPSYGGSSAGHSGPSTAGVHSFGLPSGQYSQQGQSPVISPAATSSHRGQTFASTAGSTTHQYQAPPPTQALQYPTGRHYGEETQALESQDMQEDISSLVTQQTSPIPASRSSGTKPPSKSVPPRQGGSSRNEKKRS